MAHHLCVDLDILSIGLVSDHGSGVLGIALFDSRLRRAALEVKSADALGRLGQVGDMQPARG